MLREGRSFAIDLILQVSYGDLPGGYDRVSSQVLARAIIQDRDQVRSRYRQMNAPPDGMRHA